MSAPKRFVPLAGLAAAAILAFSAVLATACGARADPPIWVVRGEGAPVVLFGSVHLLSAATQWRTPTLDAALAKADQVWFEVPVDAATAAQAGRLALKSGLQPAGRTLEQDLGAALYARVAALAEQEGLPVAALQRLKPWLADLTLSVTYFEKVGARADLGVEQQIAGSAPATAERNAFETAPEQIGLLSDMPAPEQVAGLKQTLDEVQADPGIFARMAGAWSRGDVPALSADVIEPMRREDPALYERLLVERNRRFAARIAELSAGSRRVFVVVGVGHLIGPDSVPAMLRARGIRVEGP